MGHHPNGKFWSKQHPRRRNLLKWKKVEFMRRADVRFTQDAAARLAALREARELCADVVAGIEQ